MKKAIFGILVLTLMITATSCKKNNSSSGGSWTFKNNTYNVGASSSALGTLLFSDLSANSLSFDFGSALPTTGGSFLVVNSSPSAANQVYITASVGGTSYDATGGNGSNQHVTVTVSGGKVSVSGSGVELQNFTNASDSAAVSCNVSQL